MEVKASWRYATRPAKAAGPALAAFLVTGAGVAAIAQPIEPRAEPAPTLALAMVPHVPVAKPSIHAATVRIVLPPSTARQRSKLADSSGFTPSRLDAMTPELGTAAAPSSQLAMAPATPALDMAAAPLVPQGAPKPAPMPMAPPRGKGGAAGLAAAAGLGDADYSAAMRTISARPEPKAIPMVDAESRTTLARMNGGEDAMAPSSRSDRLEALQPAAAPAPARSLIEAGRPHKAQPAGMSSIRMQDEGISRYRRTSQGLAFDVATSINGASVGKVSLLIRDDENISIRLADLLAAVQPGIAPALYQKLSASQAAQSHVTFNELREAGIAVRFNDDDRLILGIK